MADSNPEVQADTLPKDALFLFSLRLLTVLIWSVDALSSIAFDTWFMLAKITFNNLILLQEC